MVIGGGLSGLACAWHLRKLGLPVLLLERGSRFGGVISTIEKDGFRFDIGPQSFLAGESLRAVITELGLGSQICAAPPRSPRYIFHRGRLVPAPLSPPGLLRTSLIGMSTKLRFALEPLRRSHPPEDDESIAAFVRRKFGQDLLDNLVAPFVSGVYAGDPEKLSLRSCFPSVHSFETKYGSVIRGAIKTQREAGKQSRTPLCNFTTGVSVLTDAFAAQLGDCARLNVETLSIRPRSNDSAAGFEVACRQNGLALPLEAAAVVVATPADRAAELLAATEPKFAHQLNRIEYAGVAQVSAGYRVAKMAPAGIPASGDTFAGFGFLVPRAERLRLLGTVWNSALFPGRAPEAPAAGEKLGAFTSFFGGATDPALVRLDEREIAQIAHADFAKAMFANGTPEPPVTTHVTRWERAIPQYNLGHASIVAALGELCAAHPGVFLAGNYLSGPSIGSCVEQSNRVAVDAARFLGTAVPPTVVP